MSSENRMKKIARIEAEQQQKRKDLTKRGSNGGGATDVMYVLAQKFKGMKGATGERKDESGDENGSEWGSDSDDEKPLSQPSGTVKPTSMTAEAWIEAVGEYFKLVSAEFELRKASRVVQRKVSEAYEAFKQCMQEEITAEEVEVCLNEFIAKVKAQRDQTTLDAKLRVYNATQESKMEGLSYIAYQAKACLGVLLV